MSNESKTVLVTGGAGVMGRRLCKGLIERAYFYGFDERGPEYLPVIKELFGFVKQRYPGVRTLTTAGFTFKHDAWREDNVDAYCPLSSVYDPQRAETMRKAGKQVWWYTCCGPKFPYANFSSTVG